MPIAPPRPSLLLLPATMLFATGCWGVLASSGDAPPADLGPRPYTMSLDTALTDPYGTLEEGAVTVAGRASASLGLDSVSVHGSPAEVAADTSFSRRLELWPGLHRVEVSAFDTEQHLRRGDRSVLVANYLPETTVRADALRLRMDQPLLDRVSDIATAALLEEVNLAELIPVGETISGGGCTVAVRSVRHHPPEVAMWPESEGWIGVHVRVPGITVNVGGRCFDGITVRDSSQIDQLTIELWVGIWAEPPGEDGCARLGVGEVAVAITSFDIDLRLGGLGPLSFLLGVLDEAIGEALEGFVRGEVNDALQAEVPDAARDALLAAPLLDFAIEETILQTEIDGGLCLTSMDVVPLDPATGALGVDLGLGSHAAGPGGIDVAPGAPVLPLGELTPEVGTLYADPAFLSQLLFALWNGRAFDTDDVAAGAERPITVGLLSAVAPGMRELGLPPTTPLRLDVRPRLAPIVSAPRAELPGRAQVSIGLGDLELIVSAEGRPVLTINAHADVGLAFDLVDGVLRPRIIDEQTELSLTVTDAEFELNTRDRENLEEMVLEQARPLLSDLLGDFELELPDIGLPLPTTVGADPSGALALPLGAFADE